MMERKFIFLNSNSNPDTDFDSDSLTPNAGVPFHFTPGYSCLAPTGLIDL